MSSPETKPRNSRRRRPVGEKAAPAEAPEPVAAPKVEKTAAAASAAAAKRRRPRQVYKSIPVSADSIGTNAVGKIYDIAKRGTNSFGFILVDAPGVPSNEKPTIYFSLKDYTDAEYIARRGYLVQFTIEKDEKDRPFASQLTLTPEGRVAAAAREERISATKTENGGAEAVEKPARAPRPRNPNADDFVTLKVSCEGKTEVHDIEAKIYQSIGKLKYTAVELFGAPITFTVFTAKSAEHPNGELLTKAILRTLKDGDSIHLGSPIEQN